MMADEENLHESVEMEAITEEGDDVKIITRSHYCGED
jgi:hypothetical protein